MGLFGLVGARGGRGRRETGYVVWSLVRRTGRSMQIKIAKVVFTVAILRCWRVPPFVNVYGGREESFQPGLGCMR